MLDIVVHHKDVRSQLRSHYTLDQLATLEAQLQAQGTLQFYPLANGLFPAARVTASNDYTGYGSVWVRDTVHIAHAHYVRGHVSQAVQTMATLMAHFQSQRPRFQAVIAGSVAPHQLYERPQIKFCGDPLSELPTPWPQAQNDALGYFLWFYSQLGRDGQITPTVEAVETLALFPPYFGAICYWQDADNGHWEESPKIAASSIGTVVAGLQALQAWLGDHPPESTPTQLLLHQYLSQIDLETLIARGKAQLDAILPAESIQPDTYRRYDAALLFLIYPLQVVTPPQAHQIVDDVRQHLQGSYGIRRYLGDSFWCADYRQKLDPQQRTTDFSQDMAMRDALLNPGEEAQWCLFDPILSVIYGLWFQASRQPTDLDRQTYYLNRALGQLTAADCAAGAYRCPELYYLEQGVYRPNDSTPLYWTQANLWLALHQMELSLRLQSHAP